MGRTKAALIVFRGWRAIFFTHKESIILGLDKTTNCGDTGESLGLAGSQLSLREPRVTEQVTRHSPLALVHMCMSARHTHMYMQVHDMHQSHIPTLSHTKQKTMVYSFW